MNKEQKQLAEYILSIGNITLEDRRDKLIEELSELIRGLIKNDKEKTAVAVEYVPGENIIEELADVQILLFEYIKKAENQSEVSDMIYYKLNRYWRKINE